MPVRSTARPGSPPFSAACPRYAYYVDPRAIDVDINVFRASGTSSKVFTHGALAPPRRVTAHMKRLSRKSGATAKFVSVGDAHPSIILPHTTPSMIRGEESFAPVPSAAVAIPILAAEDLPGLQNGVRSTQDWIDIDQILALTAGDLDIDDVRRWVTRIVGADDARLPVESGDRRDPDR